MTLTAAPLGSASRPIMVNIQDLFDDAKCFQTIRDMRWPDGVACPSCGSTSVVKNGRDDTQPDRQRYECKGCRRRFDDLTGTVFAGHHLPLRAWIACSRASSTKPAVAEVLTFQPTIRRAKASITNAT